MVISEKKKAILLPLAEDVLNKVNNNVDGNWYDYELNAVKCEFTEEVATLKNNEVIIVKKKQPFSRNRRLESTYILTDSGGRLCNTALGKKILEYQDLLDKIVHH